MISSRGDVSHVKRIPEIICLYYGCFRKIVVRFPPKKIIHYLINRVCFKPWFSPSILGYPICQHPPTTFGISYVGFPAAKGTVSPQVAPISRSIPRASLDSSKAASCGTPTQDAVLNIWFECIQIHPGRLTAWTWKCWFGRWFSFSRGLFSGSMLIFQGTWIFVGCLGQNTIFHLEKLKFLSYHGRTSKGVFLELFCNKKPVHVAFKNAGISESYKITLTQ